MQRKRIMIGILAIGLLTVTAIWSSSAADQAEPAEVATTATSIFDVEGMTCGGCEVAVKRVVNELDGVVEVEASHREGRATVIYDPERATPEQIVQAIERLGYEAKPERERDGGEGLTR